MDFHELLAMDADTNVRNMATDLQDISLLDIHPVKYLSRRSLVQNGVGSKHGHQSGLLFQ